MGVASLKKNYLVSHGETQENKKNLLKKKSNSIHKLFLQKQKNKHVSS